MIDTTAGLQFEIRRLRDIVEKQYLEIAWQQSELRSRGGKAKIFKFGAGDLAHTNLTGNAGYAVFNQRGVAAVADARGNWWGDASGAPTAGGNAVSAGVNAGSPAAVPFALAY